MAEERPQIFREESLEKVVSQDRLDTLLQVVRPQLWLGISAVAIGFLLALVWSIFGRVPARVTGTAILVKPKQVVPFQSPSSGQIEKLIVSVGDVVQEGDLMATLDLPELEKELEQERIRLEQFTERTSKMTDLERDLAENERGFIALQRDLITQRVKKIEQDAASFKEKSDRFIAEQRRSLETWRDLSEQLSEALKSREAARAKLTEKGLMSEDQLLDMRNRRIVDELTLAELDVREGQLEVTENAARETFDAKMDLVRDLGVELNDLELRDLLITRRLSQDELNSEGDRLEIEMRVRVLEALIATRGEVRSEHTGEVLEISAAPGQHVIAGERIGKLEIEDHDAKLMAIAYFSIKDGKRIEPDARIQVSPSTVVRERYGGMLGKVERVSTYPVTIAAAANQIGDREQAHTLLGGHSRIEVMVSLDEDEASHTGFAWTSGLGPKDVKISPGTTANVRVTIEEPAPITLILPFLRSTSGI
jgi:HlyD family secretion protein